MREVFNWVLMYCLGAVISLFVYTVIPPDPEKSEIPPAPSLVLFWPLTLIFTILLGVFTLIKLLSEEIISLSKTWLKIS